MFSSDGLPADRPGRFSRDYRRMVENVTAVAETQAPNVPQQVKEKLLRCLWFEQYFDTAGLRTEDGRALRLYSPGYWNEGSGPDFRNAEMAFGDGSRIRGDVELHVKVSGWKQHGHAQDPAYGNVRLHVVLHNDLPGAMIRHDSRDIPQLVLGLHLSADLKEIVGALDPQVSAKSGVGHEGPCCRSARAMGRDTKWIGRFLDIAGDERMLLKAQQLAHAMKQATPDDVMYAALMDCMGYSANRHGFKLLCRAAPLRELRRWVPIDAGIEERHLAVQAILFGAAGFLKSAADKPAGDTATETLLAALLERWNAIGKAWPCACPDTSAWVLHRTRPVNHPVRRIAAIAAFLARHLHSGLCRAMITAVESVPTGGREATRCRQTVEKLCDLFDEAPPCYWQERTTFGAEVLKRPNRLIGAVRAGEIVVNAIIPHLLALSRGNDTARMEQRLHNIYSSLRPLAANAVTKYMSSRIFTDDKQAKRTVTSARRQQGLLQIFHDFCETSDRTCESCGFLTALEDHTE